MVFSRDSHVNPKSLESRAHLQHDGQSVHIFGHAEETPKANNKRGFPRYQMAELKAVVKGHRLDVADISAEGLLIGQEVPGLNVGDAVTFQLLLTLLEKPMKIVIQAFVVRNSDGKLAMTYAKPGPTWHRVLSGLAKRREA